MHSKPAGAVLGDRTAVFVPCFLLARSRVEQLDRLNTQREANL